MTSRIRTTTLALVAAISLVAAPLLGVTAASAATPSQANILFFSNALWTDQVEEDPTMAADLAETGATVTLFDGGDGSGAAWTAALAGKDVLVIPESEYVYEPGGTAVISDDAALVIQSFVNAGGRLLIAAGYNPQLISFVTGIDYTSNWTGGVYEDPWTLQVPEPALPAELIDSNGTYPVAYDIWTPEQLAGFQPLYIDASGVEFVAAKFPVGAGFIGWLAYDWYPDDEEPDYSSHLVWNVVLQYLANVPITVAAPALAVTGVNSSIALTGGAGLLLLGIAAVVIVRTRRVEHSV